MDRVNQHPTAAPEANAERRDKKELIPATKGTAEGLAPLRRTMDMKEATTRAEATAPTVRPREQVRRIHNNF